MPPKPASPTKRRRAAALRSLGAKLLLSIFLPLAVLASAEGILRWANFGRNLDFFVPDGAPGTFRSNPDFTALFFPPSFGLKPDNFRIKRAKPAGTFRVFVLGESAAMGVPEPGFGLTAQLRAQLTGRLPGQNVEVYNLAITAINSHVVLRIALEALDFHPDLLVIYMGNNEVVGPYGPGSAINDHVLSIPIIRTSLALRATRLGQALESIAGRIKPISQSKAEWRGLETFSGHTVAADDPRMQRVYDNFKANLNDILAAANGAGVKVALCTVAVNIRDSAPFASLHRAGFAGKDRQEWQEAMDRAERAIAAGEFTAAEAQLHRSMQIDGGFAEAHFSLGKVDEALGRRSLAAREYREALRLDGLRFRADAGINGIIRTLGKQYGAMMVDAATTFGTEPADDGSIADASLFLEHVHFRWKGNYELGALIASRVLREMRIEPGPRSEAEVAAALGYTEYGRSEILSLIDKITGRPPFTGQKTYAESRSRLLKAMDDSEKKLGTPGVLRQCAGRIEESARRQPGVAFTWFHLAAIDFRLGDVAAALKASDEVLRLEPPSPENGVQRAYILYALGRHNEAETALLESIAAFPYYYQSYYILAQMWSESGQSGKATGFFRAALATMPSTRTAHEILGHLLLANKDAKGAEREWRIALKLTPDVEGVLLPLSKLLLSQNRSDEAFALFQRAYHYNPRNFTVNSLLEQIDEQRGETSAQADVLVALTKSGPVAAEVYLKAGLLLASLGRDREAELQLLLARKHARLEGASQVEVRADSALQRLPKT